MEKLVGDLIELGLTEGEAKVYVALTEIGSSTVGPIVHKSSVAYSNVYEILDRLIKKGLVSFVIKEKTKYFQASSPENIKEYLAKKEEELELQKQKINKILPNLENLKNIAPQQEAEVFVGIKGLRTGYEKLFSKLGNKEENIFFYAHKEEWAEIADNFYFSIGELIKRANTRGISNMVGKESEFNKKAKKFNVKIRYANFPIPGNIEGNRGMIFIISWGKMPTAILIKSKVVFDDFKQYFESVWKVARE